MLYLSGEFSNAAGFAHLIHLEKALRGIPYLSIIPPFQAVDFTDREGVVNKKAMAAHLATMCSDTANVFVGSLDNAGPYSDTVKEYNLAIQYTGRAIVYSTDYRITGIEELGRNTLFNFQRTVYVHHPCRFTELDRVNQYYMDLAKKIHDAIQLLGL